MIGRLPATRSSRRSGRTTTLLGRPTGSQLRSAESAPSSTRSTGPTPTSSPTSDTVRLDHSRLRVDVHEFRSAAELGLSLLRVGRSEEAFEHLELAEAAYAGDFLEEDLYAEWAVKPREELRATYISVARALAEIATASGDHDRSSRYALRILERDAYDERAHLLHTSALAEAGRHGQSRRAYHAYVTRMEEIGRRAGVDSSSTSADLSPSLRSRRSEEEDRCPRRIEPQVGRQPLVGWRRSGLPGGGRLRDLPGSSGVHPRFTGKSGGTLGDRRRGCELQGQRDPAQLEDVAGAAWREGDKGDPGAPATALWGREMNSDGTVIASSGVDLNPNSRAGSAPAGIGCCSARYHDVRARCERPPEDAGIIVPRFGDGLRE